jgi:serine/threonine-protein kinase
MADIHLAQADIGVGDATRLVVIKEMLPCFSGSAQFADALVTEAKLAARLSHANVVKVEDLGRVGESLFIAMEYVEGLDLRELLRQCAKGKLALPVEFSLRVVIEVLRGLSFAHRARDEAGGRLGLVHRDVSPSNVLLSFDGEVKVCDFGIARANALAEDPEGEVIAGKAGYMSPEQAHGDALDARADVYAAGIILWELLAGRRLYRAATGQRLLDVARAAVVPALPTHDLPRESELHAIVDQALRTDRDLRYASAQAMLEDLEDYAAAAGMVASQIRFGAWLTEHFGTDIVRDRRARERAIRALARGPAAVIRPLDLGGAPPAPPAATFLPDYDATPSVFLVAPRAAAAGAEAHLVQACSVDALPTSSSSSPPASITASALAKPRAPAAFRAWIVGVIASALGLGILAYAVARVLRLR